ncbi:MAG: hypothetical protein ACYTEQ_19200 [Planctomycetota bacterium]|jgi:hypothetical protein
MTRHSRRLKRIETALHQDPARLAHIAVEDLSDRQLRSLVNWLDERLGTHVGALIDSLDHAPLEALSRGDMSMLTPEQRATLANVADWRDCSAVDWFGADVLEVS